MKRKLLLAIGLCLAMLGTVSLSVRAAEINAVAEEIYEGEQSGGEIAVEEMVLQQENVAISETNFPDANFRQYVLEEIDTNGDESLSQAEIVNTESIFVTERNITSLKGIEYFTNLLVLKCDDNQLVDLDVSACKKLWSLSCNNNQLTRLNVKECKELKHLSCSNNQWRSLDLSECQALVQLFLGDDNKCNSKLEELNISNCSALSTLTIGNTPLRTLTMKNCSSMTALGSGLHGSGWDHTLENLDVSGCTSLGSLVFMAVASDTERGAIKTINASGCNTLEMISVPSCQLEKIDVTGCTSLKTLEIDNNYIKDLDLSTCSALNLVDCSDNLLTDLVVENCTLLGKLVCEGNQITELDVSKCAELIELFCERNQIKSLKLPENNIVLEALFCADNQIEELDASGFTALDVLSFEKNPLVKLDVSNCTALDFCAVESAWDYDGDGLNDEIGRYIKEVDVSGCTALEGLYIGFGAEESSIKGKLEKIDVTGCAALKNLHVGNNQLKTIDISTCIALESLGCSDNQLTELDISNNEKLAFLNCESNKLTTLNTNSNTLLTEIYCNDNPMPYLDLSECDAYDKKSVIGGTQIILTDAGLNMKDYPEFDINRIGGKSNIVINNGVITIEDITRVAHYDYQCKIGRDDVIWSVSLYQEGSPLAPKPPLDKDFPFSDVSIIEGNWKYEAVKYVFSNNIMGGVGGSDQFQPDNSLTRAMFATVLYRMAGEPTVTFSDKFSDVVAGKWYSDAILWANQQGIVNGYSDGSYGINDNITREQIAKMLYLYGQSQGYDVSGVAALDSFTDKDSVSGWATGYMQWAVDAGMISGKPNGDDTFRLDPKGQATRAECAKMLMKFSEKYGKNAEDIFPFKRF